MLGYKFCDWWNEMGFLTKERWLSCGIAITITWLTFSWLFILNFVWVKEKCYPCTDKMVASEDQIVSIIKERMTKYRVGIDKKWRLSPLLLVSSRQWSTWPIVYRYTCSSPIICLFLFIAKVFYFLLFCFYNILTIGKLSDTLALFIS